MRKEMISVFSALTGAVVGAAAIGKKKNRKIGEMRNLSEKHLSLFLMMNQWVRIKQEGKNISEYLEREGYRNIAIYGISYAGETLIEELRGTNIHVSYGIDKRANFIYSEIDMVTMEDSLDHVDVIIVTAITFFDEIKKELEEKLDCPILSLEDILEEM